MTAAIERSLKDNAIGKADGRPWAVGKVDIIGQLNSLAIETLRGDFLAVFILRRAVHQRGKAEHLRCIFQYVCIFVLMPHIPIDVRFDFAADGVKICVLCGFSGRFNASDLRRLSVGAVGYHVAAFKCGRIHLHRKCFVTGQDTVGIPCVAVLEHGHTFAALQTDVLGRRGVHLCQRQLINTAGSPYFDTRQLRHFRFIIRHAPGKVSIPPLKTVGLAVQLPCYAAGGKFVLRPGAGVAVLAVFIGRAAEGGLVRQIEAVGYRAVTAHGKGAHAVFVIVIAAGHRRAFHGRAHQTADCGIFIAALCRGGGHAVFHRAAGLQRPHEPAFAAADVHGLDGALYHAEQVAVQAGDGIVRPRSVKLSGKRMVSILADGSPVFDIA